MALNLIPEMKTLSLLSLIFFLNGIISFGQSTATDFTLTDCSGNSHTLFTELDAGKVIVISFVMPCTSCIGPSVSAYNSVLNYSTSNPGRVLFYLSDDLGTTACSTLSTWASQNGMDSATVISNTALQMNQYNGNGLGMPKIVVLGGSSHLVYFNDNNGTNTHDIDAAIIEALGPSSIDESSRAFVNLKIFPSPVNDNATITYGLDQSQEANIEIINVLGENVKTLVHEKQTKGNHNLQIDFETFANGFYFIKLSTAVAFEIIKFSVVH